MSFHPVRWSIDLANTCLRLLPRPLLKALQIASCAVCFAAVHTPAVATSPLALDLPQAFPCGVAFALMLDVNELVFRRDWTILCDAGEGSDALTALCAGPVAAVWAALMLFLALYRPGEKPGDLIVSVGAGRACGVVVLALCALLWHSVHVMGRRFTRTLRVQAGGHDLCKEGAYGYVRHPGYAAVLAAVPVMGVGIAANAWYCALCLPLSYAVMVTRVRAEEQMLVESFGAPYLEYKRETGDLLPGVDLMALPASHYEKRA